MTDCREDGAVEIDAVRIARDTGSGNYRPSSSSVASVQWTGQTIDGKLH